MGGFKGNGVLKISVFKEIYFIVIFFLNETSFIKLFLKRDVLKLNSSQTEYLFYKNMPLEIVLIPFAIGISCLTNILVERSTLRRREKGKYTEEI